MDARGRLFLTLLLGAALLHAPSLQGGFVWDDRQMIVENADLDEPGSLPRFLVTSYFGERAEVSMYRPLVNASLLLDAVLHGRGEATGFRLTNILLHLVAGVLLWSLLRRVTRRPWLPELAGVLFLVHPASAEPVAWIVARGDLLAAALSLAALHCHLSARRRPLLVAGSAVCYLLALFAKLSAAPLPLLALLVDRLAGREADEGRPVGGRAAWRHLAWVVPPLVYFALRAAALPTLLPSGVSRTWHDPPGIAALFVAGAILFRYAVIFLLPAGLCADYSADPVFFPRLLSSVAENAAVPLMAAGLLALLAAAVIARRRLPWFTFGALWLFAALIPVSQVVPIGAVMADRYLYLPAAGGVAALAAAVLALPRLRLACALAILACFSAVTVDREAVWRDDGTMNADVLSPGNYPRSADARNRLALYWRDRGDAVREGEEYVKGLEADPRNRFLLKNYGAWLFERKNPAAAERILREALRLSDRRDAQKGAICWNLAVVLLAQAREAEAALVLEEAILCRPPNPAAFERLASLYRDSLGRPDRAREVLESSKR